MPVMNVGRMSMLVFLRLVLMWVGVGVVDRGGFGGMGVAMVIIAVMVAVFVRHCRMPMHMPVFLIH